MAETSSDQRPTLGADQRSARDATDAVGRFVAELQAGLDDGDSDLYNRHFANDVLWGSPFGETILGYQDLHAIHRRLTANHVAGPSRYEIERVASPHPDVALAQVRRTALDADGHALDPDAADSFSEIALYVLVRRDDTWWLAAGQNTVTSPALKQALIHQ
jgi:uncharacterized protein (TIGR02246 family)